MTEYDGLNIESDLMQTKVQLRGALASTHRPSERSKPVASILLVLPEYSPSTTRVLPEYYPSTALVLL